MRIVKTLTVCAGLAASATPALAMDAIMSRGDFLDTLGGRDLTIRLYGLSLEVAGDGEIKGRALGRDVTGQWTWEDGYFCRDLMWGEREIGYNCQLVQVDGNKMRFTTDRGAGDYADFRLR